MELHTRTRGWPRQLQSTRTPNCSDQTQKSTKERILHTGQTHGRNTQSHRQRWEIFIEY